MSQPLNIQKQDIAGSVFQESNLDRSEFRDVSLAGAVFEGVDLSGARFFNVNLRQADIGAFDFGGTSFSCMNTGEDQPRIPADIQNIELEACTVRHCDFERTKFADCRWNGAMIDDVLVTDLIACYRRHQPLT